MRAPAVRVMYLSASGELGGGERSLLDVIASVRRAQPSWDVHLLTAADGPLVAEARALGARASVLAFPESFARLGEYGAAPGRLGTRLVRSSSSAAAYALRLRRAIAAVDPDIVHSNSLKMHVLGVCASGRAAVVWHLHDYLGSRPMTARLLRWSAGGCAIAVANSESVAADARVALASRVAVVPMMNGVDLDRFSPSGPALDLDRLAGGPPAPVGTVRVGLVATFGRWKGHTTFLDALARIDSRVPLRAYVVGGALYQTDRSQHSLDELRQHADRAGVAGRVTFTGFVPDVAAAMRALDVVVHASTSPEPFGLVIAEGMACGRAVIASDAGGAQELFTPGADAVAHTPGDAASLAARISELAADPAARVRLGRAARQTAERRFDRARLAFDLLPVYQRAAAA